MVVLKIVRPAGYARPRDTTNKVGKDEEENEELDILVIGGKERIDTMASALGKFVNDNDIKEEYNVKKRLGRTSNNFFNVERYF